MKKTNKILSVLLALSMVCSLSLTACKEEGGSASSDSASVSQTNSVTLDKTQITVCVDDDFYLTAVTDGGFVVWRSSDKEIATVSSVV